MQRDPELKPRPTFNRVLLGYDGSESSKLALDFAAREAILRAASLQVVYSWTLPDFGYGPSVGAMADLEKAGNEVLGEAAKTLSSKYPDLRVTTLLLEGNAASRIIEQTEEVDLVVVGARGHGGFSSLLLGSVSDQLIHHCPVPTVVVRY
ncbi:MAG: universal stress protein [Ferrimicrobium sp.]